MKMSLPTVYYNLRESHYSISINGIEYFFSSEFNLNRFKEKLIKARLEMKNSFLIKKYPLTFKLETHYNFDGISDLNLYMVTENKGFCVKCKGEFSTWQTTTDTILQNAINNSYHKLTKELEQNKED